MSESLSAYIFERPVPKDGRGSVMIVAYDRETAEKVYRDKAREKLIALLKEFGRTPDESFNQLVEEDFRTAEVREIPLRSGIVILDQGI